MTETQITSSILLIFGLLTLYGIIKNKKVLSIVALLICISSSILGNILLNVGNSYNESSWKRMAKYISKEIKNGNHKEVSEGIDEVHNNYSKYDKNKFMGYQYRDQIEKRIKSKKIKK